MDILHTPSTPWNEVKRHARLWRRCFALAIVREMQFRANFSSIILVGLAQIVLGLVPILILFEHATEVDGWKRADMIVLLGIFQIMQALVGFAVTRNMWELSQGVEHGTLDLILIRPVNAQFYSSTRWVRPEMIFTLLGGVAVVIVALAQGRGMPSLGQLVQVLILLASGFVLIGCASMTIAYLAFWMTNTSALIQFFSNEVLGAGRYPVGFFPIIFRVVLTFLVPMAFAVTFPAQAITRGISWWIVVAAVAFAAVTVWLLRQFWNVAVRRYSSASS